MKIKTFGILALIFLIGGFLMQTVQGSYPASRRRHIRVLLVGASVGKAWNFPGWPTRMHNNDYVMEMVAEYSFDKSNVLGEIFMRPKRKFHLTRTYLRSLFKQAHQKPDIIIIKECAAYFPGDLEKYKILVRKWVDQCKIAGVSPILTTVIPVTEQHSQTKPGRLEGILKYNDWVREYTKEIGISYIDLESALRISDKNRSLRPELTSGDGLHLNKKAYDILDVTIDRDLKKVLNKPN